MRVASRSASRAPWLSTRRTGVTPTNVLRFRNREPKTQSGLGLHRVECGDQFRQLDGVVLTVEVDGADALRIGLQRKAQSGDDRLAEAATRAVEHLHPNTA